MKTFVSNNYQVTPMDNGGVKVLIEGASVNTRIIYDPDAEKPWSSYVTGYCTTEANNLADLELSKGILELLHSALEVVDKQDLFDKEIVFIR